MIKRTIRKSILLRTVGLNKKFITLNVRLSFKTNYERLQEYIHVYERF